MIKKSHAMRLLGKKVTVSNATYMPISHDKRDPSETFKVVGVSAGLIALLLPKAGQGHTGTTADAVSVCVDDYDKYSEQERIWYVDPNSVALAVKSKHLSPQCAKLLRLMKEKGSVTALEAGGVVRVRSLSRRIVDLKEAGYNISRDLKTDTSGQRYARYFLEGELTGVSPTAV